MLRRAVAADAGTTRLFARSWPLLEPAFVVESLWAVPALLRRCAPHLDPAEAASLRRGVGAAWTDADLPLLDAARAALGDPEAGRRRRARERAAARERRERERVADDLIAADDGELRLMSMLRGADLQYSLVDRWQADDDAGPLDGPFAHVIVDEAQELTDAQWAMLRRRCPSGSFTVVGDRAQARAGFPETWSQRLARVGITRVREAILRVNYRTPAEVMAVAEPVIRAALPDANVPRSVRHGAPVRRGEPAEAAAIVAGWLAGHPSGVVGVIASRGTTDIAEHERVVVLDPVGAKGLEFDLVVVIDPGAFGEGVTAAVDRYVAMTRATAEMVVLGD
jgi:DNA helicase IV